MRNGNLTFEQALVYAELMERYGRLVNTYCLLRAESLDEARGLHDAVDEAVWCGVGTLREGYSERQLRHWLFKVVHHAAVDYHRRRRRHMPLDPSTPLAESSDEATRELLDDLVGELPEADRSLVHRLLEGYTPRELAQQEGITYAAMRQRLHRIRVKLTQIKTEKYG